MVVWGGIPFFFSLGGVLFMRRSIYSERGCVFAVYPSLIIPYYERICMDFHEKELAYLFLDSQMGFSVDMEHELFLVLFDGVF